MTIIAGGAFFGCSKLKGVVIHSSVKTIVDDAFYGCEGLTEVKIPGGVTKIGQLAFAKCSKLNKVYWFADANCNVAVDAFAGIASPATLYVRKGEKSAIEGNGQTWWGKFKLVEFCVVTFQDGEGNKLGEQLVESNGTATAPTAPTKEGYIVEWQLGGKEYDFNARVTKDITLVAVWKKKEESTPCTPKDPKTAVQSVQLAAVRAVRNPVGEALELEGMERAGLGERGVRGAGGGERWGEDAARGEVRMRGVLGRGEPCGSPLWARIRGSKDPRLFKDRPTDGAASVCENLCGFEEVKYDENVRSFGPLGPA